MCTVAAYSENKFSWMILRANLLLLKRLLYTLIRLKVRNNQHTAPRVNLVEKRGHPDLNRGPLDLQSNALPLSYTPMTGGKAPSKKLGWTEAGAAKSFVRCGIRTHALIRGPEFSWQLCIAEQGNPWVWRLRPLGQPDMLSLTPNFFHLIFSRLKPNKTDRAQDRTGDLLRVKQTW